MISSALEAATAPPPTAASTQPPTGIADKTAFLKLLVAQIKNQDPLNPTDSTQFLSQLTQYSQLEQLIEMNSSLAAVRDALTPKEP